jgi:hypothetical protein
MYNIARLASALYFVLAKPPHAAALWGNAAGRGVVATILVVDLLLSKKHAIEENHILQKSCY